MGIPNGTHQAASNAIAALGAYISLHTGAGGGTTGTNEATGGGYTRKQTTWTPGSTGVNTGSTVNIPCAAGTYTEGGIFSASTSGTFVGSGAFTGGNVIVSGSGASIDVTPSITA
ncbi:hypothetical protein A5746_14245 [Mycolicibacterium conceptionense]|uniref:phage tail fiber protein n=2 Tax=Mycolicibacterium conceptionense TaxID=451644 RepID=UPI00096DB102|nr:hypothetical protein [Mycolicibacterium conceptionense]OMB98595.1 hypothetical protein A5746_14245 [Mycolicibacterium conceptionense]